MRFPVVVLLLHTCLGWERTPDGAALADGCWHVYLDVGSNIGVQVRKLFEPERYGGALVLPVFERFFGSAEQRRGSTCAIGIEPNPRHIPRLRGVEQRYKSLGWRTHFLTRTAASVAAGKAKFYFNDNFIDSAKHSGWAASLTNAHRDHGRDTSAVVAKLDLAKFLGQILARRLPPRPEGAPNASTVMKVDIEGAEYDVMSALLARGVLCDLDLLFAEFHPSLARISAGLEFQRPWARDKFPDFLRMVTQHASCRVEVSSVDDESFLEDGMPLPSRG